MWVKENLNPINRSVEDCSVRAVAKALNVDWETAFAMLCSNAFQMGDMPHSNVVIASVLRQHGFNRKIIDNKCPNCFDIEEFCRNNPKGVFVLGTGSHVVTVIDGNYYDVWDSGKEIPIYYWYLSN